MTDYKLVPVEPTAEMVQAARELHEGEAYLPVSLYKAMLAAAPAVQGEAVEYGWRLIAVNEAWDALERALSRACNKGYMPVTMGAEWNAFDWTEAPQPAEQQPAPAVQGEPVGYVSQDFLDGKWNMDHIAKYDEGQISRAIPVFAKPPQPAPDVAMQVMEALATILRKAQGRTDAETGECIDIGAECMAIRREFDRRSKTARGVNGLAEALSGAIEYLDSDAGHGLWRDTVLSQLKEALAAHRKGDDV